MKRFRSLVQRQRGASSSAPAAPPSPERSAASPASADRGPEEEEEEEEEESDEYTSGESSPESNKPGWLSAAWTGSLDALQQVCA